jgi:uncharacterized membrane protein
MSWRLRYRVRYYIINSLWILPFLGMLIALAAVPLLHRVEEALDWQSSVNLDAARILLGTLASSMFTFVIFVSSALLIAVQLASAQLSPRIIAILFRDPVTKFSLTVFVFIFTFSLAVLVRIDTTVPLLTTRIAAYGCMASLGVFLYLIDYVGKALRPSGALRAVASLGRDVIENVYPKLLSEARDSEKGPTGSFSAGTSRTIPSLKSGVILAFDIHGLVSLAQRGDCVIEMAPHVGDYIATGDPMFRVYQGGAAIAPNLLRRSVAVGQERTFEQDPTLAFRILVDIASKGLSPAINDPTTAVLVIDQIHHLLHQVGLRSLADERVRDATGRLRLVYRTPDWEDFVHLAVTEIRHFGGTSIQVARRLRAMLEHLIQALPAERTQLLRQELSLLHRSAERSFPEPEDRALAAVGDPQGVGAKS